jgi:Holliday junction resolvase RusA-like endonuclease
MSDFKITIPYTPKAKASVRVSKYGGHYNPSAKGMNLVKAHVIKHLEANPMPRLTGPLLVICHFRIPAPLGRPQVKRRPQHLKPHIIRPDGDNLEKFLNDCLTGLVWNDDSQIAWLLRSKSLTFAKEGETVLYVKELDDVKPDYEAIIEDIKKHIEIEVTHGEA